MIKTDFDFAGPILSESHVSFAEAVQLLLNTIADADLSSEARKFSEDILPEVLERATPAQLATL